MKTHPQPWRGTTILVRRRGTTVDAGVAYVPTDTGDDVQFAWAEQTAEKVVAELIADGVRWTIAVDYAAKPDPRVTVFSSPTYDIQEH